MICYHTIDKPIENGVNLSSNLYLYPWDCPDEFIAEGEKLINTYSIKEVDFWECEPRSDAGIYDKRTSCSTISLSFTDLVYDGEAFVGVYIKRINRILYFGQSGVTIINKSEYVGGWGDITEGVEYYLANNNQTK
ncbi:MAG: hypothetical protein IJD22_01355 [Clostridia bacterium]|nr:hypothetical protein [Clostridia bacterium]